MNVFSSLAKILIILLILAFAAAFVCLGAMIIVPKFSVFGLHYVSGDNKVLSYHYDTENNEYSYRDADSGTESSSGVAGNWSSVSAIDITTNSWDIVVAPLNTSESSETSPMIYAYIARDFRGFATTETSIPQFSGFVFEEKTDGMHLSMSLVEPDGLFSRTNTYLKVVFDSQLLSNRVLNITSKSGKVTLGNTYKEDSVSTTVKDIYINANEGGVYLNDISVGRSLNITKQKGDITATKYLTSDTIIKISSGFGKVFLTNVGTQDEPHSLSIEDMFNTNLQFDTIYGDLYIVGKSGYVKGKEIKKALAVDAVYCDVYLDTVSGVAIFNNKDGSLEVETLNKGLIAYVDGNGSIKCTSLIGESSIQTNNGEVTIKNVHNDIGIISNNGKINLNNAVGRVVNYRVDTVNSDVTITDVNGSVNLTTNDKGRAKVYVSYRRMIGANNYLTYSGRVEVKLIGPGYEFWLKEWYTASNVYIKVSNLTEEKVKKSKESVEYKDGIMIGGYAGTTDYLTLISELGSIKLYQELSV